MGAKIDLRNKRIELLVLDLQAWMLPREDLAQLLCTAFGSDLLITPYQIRAVVPIRNPWSRSVGGAGLQKLSARFHAIYYD
jgi:hypothetical protein